MKFIKQLTCLIACFVVLSSSFIVGYAVDEEEYFPAVSDLIDMGFVEDVPGVYVYSGYQDPFDAGFSFFFTNKKNSPNFDYNKLPWGSMPDYVQDILNIKVSSYMPSDANTNIPIVVLRVRPAVVEVYVGVNCFLGRLNNSNGSFNLFNCNTSPELFINSRCYWAIYNHDGSLSQAWSECPSSEYGDKGIAFKLQSYFFGNMDSSALDYYVWGGNAGKAGNYTSVSLVPWSGDNNLTVSFYQSSYGFSSGKFLPYQDNYSLQYFEYFSPPTKEDLSNQLMQQQNNKLDNMMDATGKPDSIVDDYNKAESDLVDDYNPDNLENDLDIAFDSTALEAVWFIFDYFVTSDNGLFTLFVSLLAIGIIALILGR